LFELIKKKDIWIKIYMEYENLFLIFTIK